MSTPKGRSWRRMMWSRSPVQAPDELTPQQQQGASQHPLQVQGLLEQILEYVGSMNWLYVGCVSKFFEQVYRRVQERDAVRRSRLWTCITDYYAIVTSVARLQAALALGFDPSDVARRALFSRAAGANASHDVLTWLDSYSGIKLQRDLVLEGCAMAGRLSTMQWLVTNNPHYHHCKLPARRAATKVGAVIYIYIYLTEA
jgi:hypothetical protein